MKKLHLLVQIIIGISIIAFILNKLDINQVYIELRKTNIKYFILACLSYLFLDLTLALRLSYLLKKLGHKTKFRDVFFSHMGGMIIGDITPGRSGYFLTPSILKNRAGVPITEGMSCIFAPQGIEFILKVGGAIAAIIYLSFTLNIEKKFLIYATIGSFILLIAGIMMLILSWKNEKLTARFLNKIPFLDIISKNLSSFKDRSILIKNSMDIILIFYTIGWIFAGFQWYFLGKAIGIDLSFFTFFLLHPLITILMFVPFSPAGVGFMEQAIKEAFLLFNVSGEKGFAFAVLVRASILVIDIIGLKAVIKATRKYY